MVIAEGKIKGSTYTPSRWPTYLPGVTHIVVSVQGWGPENTAYDNAHVHIWHTIILKDALLSPHCVSPEHTIICYATADLFLLFGFWKYIPDIVC